MIITKFQVEYFCSEDSIVMHYSGLDHLDLVVDSKEAMDPFVRHFIAEMEEIEEGSFEIEFVEIPN